MSNVKTLTAVTIAALFAASAFAGEQQTEMAPDTFAADFASADLDQDGALNSDEFVTFAVMRAEGGDEAFKDIVLSGEYDTKFTAHDKDASGGLDAEELGHTEKAPSDMETDEGGSMEEPDMNEG